MSEARAAKARQANPNRRKEIAWILYDVGNSAFTLLVSTVLPIYFTYLVPSAGLAETDAAGWFTAGEDCTTGTPGGFVAGDCRAKGVKELITAAGDGASAAGAAFAWLDSKSGKKSID